MRAAFSYYIHRTSTATAFPNGRLRLSRLGFSRVEGRPAAQESIGPLAVIRGPAHLRPGPSRPRFIQVCVLGHGRASRPVPAMAECSCSDLPLQAAEALKAQSWPSGGRHSSHHTTLAATFETSSKAWLGILHGLRPGEQGAGGFREATAMQAHLWQCKSCCGMAVWPNWWLPGGRGLLVSTG